MIGDFCLCLSCTDATVRFEGLTYDVHESDGWVQVILIISEPLLFPFSIQAVATDMSATGE